MEFPVFAGDDEEWIKLRPLKDDDYEAILVDGKNAIQRLNELYHAIPFEVTSTEPDEGPVMHKCKVTVTGMGFEAESQNKKFAKLMAAQQAIDFLGETGLLQQRTDFLAEKRLERIEKNREFLERNKEGFGAMIQKYKQREKKHPPNPKNSLMKINELERGKVRFSIAQQPTSGEFGGVFVIRAVFQAKIFEGRALSKKGAKLDCAEQILRATNRWTPEDEEVKMGRFADEEKRAKAQGRTLLTLANVEDIKQAREQKEELRKHMNANRRFGQKFHDYQDDAEEYYAEGAEDEEEDVGAGPSAASDGYGNKSANYDISMFLEHAASALGIYGEEEEEERRGHRGRGRGRGRPYGWKRGAAFVGGSTMSPEEVAAEAERMKRMMRPDASGGGEDLRGGRGRGGRGGRGGGERGRGGGRGRAMRGGFSGGRDYPPPPPRGAYHDAYPRAPPPPARAPLPPPRAPLPPRYQDPYTMQSYEEPYEDPHAYGDGAYGGSYGAYDVYEEGNFGDYY